MNLRQRATRFVFPGLGWVLGWLVLGCVADQRVAGREPKPVEVRSTLYQAETVPVLNRFHWKMVLNQPGKLVADRSLGVRGGYFGPNVFSIQSLRLTINFTPVSTSHTDCKAVVVGYGHARKVQEDKLGLKTYTSALVGPFPMADAEEIKEIQNIMAKAEAGLLAKHPEYGAR